MPSNHLILCHPLLLTHSIFPIIRVISNESVLCIWWPKYRSFSFSMSPSNECLRLISFRMNWLRIQICVSTRRVKFAAFGFEICFSRWSWKGNRIFTFDLQLSSGLYVFISHSLQQSIVNKGFIFWTSAIDAFVSMFLFKAVSVTEGNMRSACICLLINFDWPVIALLCCVIFHCTEKWIGCTYTNTLSFLDFLPI